MAEANLMALMMRGILETALAQLGTASDIKSTQTLNVHGYKVDVIKTHLQT